MIFNVCVSVAIVCLVFMFVSVLHSTWGLYISNVIVSNNSNEILLNFILSFHKFLHNCSKLWMHFICCFLLLLIMRLLCNVITVAVTMIMGVYGSMSVALGPCSSIVFQPNPVFVQYVKVSFSYYMPMLFLFICFPFIVCEYLCNLGLFALGRKLTGKSRTHSLWYISISVSWRCFHLERNL
jgi:hypothetical protein